MLEQATLNQAAQVLAGLRPGERADSALRAYFAARRYLRPGARRVGWVCEFASGCHGSID